MKPKIYALFAHNKIKEVQPYTPLPIKKSELIKILILPFNNVSGEQSKGYASLMRDRLEGLNWTDSIGLEIKYLQSYKQPDSFNEKMKDSLLKQEDADFIIWGDYGKENSKDYLSLKYYSRQWVRFNKLNTKLEPVSLIDFSTGAMQGDIDYIVYYISAVLNYKAFYRSFAASDSVISKTLLLRVVSLLKKNITSNKIKYNDDTYTILAGCYFFLDSVKESVYYNKLYLEQYKNDYRSWVCLSTAYSRLGELEKAKEAIDQALKVDSMSPIGFLQKGALFANSKKYSEANKIYQIALDRNPDIPLLHDLKATNYNYLYDETLKEIYIDSAIVELTMALTLVPNERKFLSFRGGLFSLKGDNEAALSDFNKALLQNPSNYELILQRALLYMNTKRIDLAIIDLEVLTRAQYKAVETYSLLATAYKIKNNLPRALENINMVLLLKEKDTTALINRANTFCIMGDSANAKKDILYLRSMLNKPYPPGLIMVMRRYIKSFRGLNNPSFELVE